MSDGANLLACPGLLVKNIYQIASRALAEPVGPNGDTMALMEICTLIEQEPGTANETDGSRDDSPEVKTK
jgi:hypothetical protein